MATTTSKKITRRDREAASTAAAPFDLAPAAPAALVVLSVIVFALVVSFVMPNSQPIGGPLQDENVGAGATLTSFRRAGDGVVTIGVFVPWNTSGTTAVLEEIVPLGTDGVEVVKSAIVAPGQASIEPTRGFPPDTLVLFPLEDAGIPPGGGPLDGAQIAVGLRGEGSVLAFVLRYRVGDETFQALITNGALLCRGPCEDEEKVAVTERQRELAADLATFLDAPSR
jgi:hypothetical protein